MKKPVSLILAVCALLSLCACGGSDTGDADTSSTKTSAGLEYESRADGTCIITSIGSFDGDELVISATNPDGERITAITSEFTFFNNFERVIFDSADLEVAGAAFYECNELSEVIVRNSTVSFGSGAFSECGGFTMELDASDVTFDEYFSDSIILLSATDCTLDAEDSAFGSSDDLEAVSFTNCDVTLDEYTFAWNESLTSVTVDGGSMSIGSSAFYGCDGLITVSIHCPVTINTEAFSDCDALETVTFGNDTVTLGDDVFSWCYSLTSVVIGHADVEFGEDVFYACPEELLIEIDGQSFNADLEPLDSTVADMDEESKEHDDTLAAFAGTLESVNGSKTFTFDELTITVTDDFEEYETEDIDYALLGDNIGVAIVKEEFDSLDGYSIEADAFSAYDYAVAAVEAVGTDGEIFSEDGYEYFIYDKNTTGTDFTYYSAVFKGSNAFWRVSFYTYSNLFDILLPSFERWCSSIAVA